MDDLYLDNIDEYVNDQNKIVTYKWLSLTLGVHVNTAKQMLYHYLEQRRKEKSGATLHATYLVSGKCLENGSMCHKVSVVREEKLEDIKSKLDMTVSIHVYSIQKSELKDSGPLYSTDYDAVKENLKNCNKYSAIRCAAAVPVSSGQLQRAQEKVLAAAPDTEGSKPGLNDHMAAASKISVKQPKGIMGMFSSKATPKSEEYSKEVKTEQKDDASPAEGAKTRPSSKADALSKFFGKPADKNAATDKPDKNIKEEVEGALTSLSAVSKTQSHSSPEHKQSIKEELLKKSSAVKGDSKDTGNKTKRLEQSDSEDEKGESQKTKRRRIKQPQPDSSDDEVIPDSPPVPEPQTQSLENEVKKEPVSHQEILEGKRRKRRRVLKSKTFLDDEGCMVTEKGYESESYSESEDDFKASSYPSEDSVSLKQSLGKREEEKKLKEKGQKKAPAAANKATKQATIFGFFQKK
ncbi:DNA polymerase delta subunit 3 [Electrophorus electricus]|uniref:DNA polymerase delta subunit 3 n=1 Tax=Electrophorus electricus TaxID=8005 RepID=A0A4W4E4E2_ELEEL|nr:DNA polymerase delta subunit 3 [Electrophorus electricus]